MEAGLGNGVTLLNFKVIGQKKHLWTLAFVDHKN